MRSNVNGQHDRQDEKLTGQLPNQFRHCPLTGQYFEPWIGHKSANWRHYLYIFDWRQDHHFMWSSEPHDGLAICRAKGTVSFSVIFRLWVLMQPQGSNLTGISTCSQVLASPATELMPSYIETCTRRTVEYFLRVSASCRFLRILSFHPMLPNINSLNNIYKQ